MKKPPYAKKTEKFVEQAFKRKEKEKISDFDAIIIDLFKEKAVAIKFNNHISIDAKLILVEDIPVYFFAKPKKKYTVVEEFPAEFSYRAKRTGMLVDKLESMIRKTVHKEKKGEITKFDAIIINPENLSEKLIVFE